MPYWTYLSSTLVYTAVPSGGFHSQALLVQLHPNLTSFERRFLQSLILPLRMFSLAALTQSSPIDYIAFCHFVCIPKPMIMRMILCDHLEWLSTYFANSRLPACMIFR